MPSMADSKRQVEETLHRSTSEVDHEAILANLQGEIDKHNAAKHGLRSSIHRSSRRRQRSKSPVRLRGEPSLRFRFKSSSGKEHHHKRRTHKERAYPTPPAESQVEEGIAHPFPREPVPIIPENDKASSNEAFRASLFDALASDEAAAYWEGVYDQPIHIYSRSSLEDGADGEMNDEQYAAYVQQRMWERKHPEVVAERRKKEERRMEEERERGRRREEFVRRKERAAWERDQRWREERNEVEADVEGGNVQKDRGDGDKYEKAWVDYLSAWTALQSALLDYGKTEAIQDKPKVKQAAQLCAQIPFPLLSGQTFAKANLEAFVRHAPGDENVRLKALKAERVRWHPDKMRQRFAVLSETGLDDETMEKVVEVFRVVDEILVEMRREK